MSRKQCLRIFLYLLLLAAVGAFSDWSGGKNSSAAALGAPAGPSTLATPCPDGTWTHVPSPNVTAYNHVLYSVASTSADNAWAVGTYAPGSSGIMPLIERWNGTEWAVDSQQGNLPSGAFLYGVAALSENDAWIVGTAASHTFTAHWDGTTWSVVPSPNVANSSNILRYVTMVSHKDVWAVGQVGIDSRGPSLTLHWDGMQWTIVPGPVNPSWNQNTVLYGATAFGSGNVWAVGSHYVSSIRPNEPLSLRWDGARWQQSDIAPVDKNFREYEMRSISGTGPADIWAVGGCNGSGPCTGGLIEHWDGSAWSIVPVSNSPGVFSWLYGVTALSANDVWAVGTTYSAATGTRTLGLHWDGTSWTQEDTPNPSYADLNWPHAVAPDRTGGVWAVGEEKEGTVERTLILRRMGGGCPLPR